MAIVKKLHGFQNAYCRIYGYTVDEDKQSITLRVKIYPDEETRKADNLDIRELRREFTISMKDFISIAEDEAMKKITSKNNENKIQEDVKKEIAEMKKNIKKLNINSELLGTVKKKIINRQVAGLKTEIAQNKIKEIFKAIISGKTIKQIGYEFLKLLPEFLKSKDS